MTAEAGTGERLEGDDERITFDGCEVIVCLGPGGVGKTTTSAALALSAARAGRRVVVLTIDPARRLADAIGVGGELGNEPTEVPLSFDKISGGTANGGQLWAAMLDPEITFTEVITSHASTSEQADRITGNRLFANLTTSLSGTNEYMAAERLWSLYNDDRFDLVVIDTPPSRHAFDFLDGPGRLVRFVDHPLYRYVLAPQRGLLRAVNAATQLIIRTIGRVVGAQLLDDVVEFFAAFEGLDDGFRGRAAEVDQLLQSVGTRFVLVTSPRPEPLAGAGWIIGRLEERGLSASSLVANRMLPLALASIDPPSDPDNPLDENLAQLASLAQLEAELLTEFQKSNDIGKLIHIPDQPTPVSTLEGLARIADQLV